MSGPHQSLKVTNWISTSHAILCLSCCRGPQLQNPSEGWFEVPRFSLIQQSHGLKLHELPVCCNINFTPKQQQPTNHSSPVPLARKTSTFCDTQHACTQQTHQSAIVLCPFVFRKHHLCRHGNHSSSVRPSGEMRNQTSGTTAIPPPSRELWRHSKAWKKNLPASG